MNKALSASCPACAGLGFIRSTPSIAHQVLREAEWRLFRKQIPRVRIRAHPDLIGWIQAEDGEVVESLQQTYGGEIVLVPEDSLAPGKYQLLEG